jgi:oligopeptide transport system ATP-binding protein
MSEKVILEVKDLKKHFQIGRNKFLKAVDGVSLQIREGETLGLVGESGCGKSTLGRTIIKIYEPTEGQIIFQDTDITQPVTRQNRHVLQKMQMIFQDPYTSLNPRMTVGDIIAEGWDIQKKYKGKKRKERIVEFLELVGLNEEHANRFPHEFSGGQRQRIGIARALTMDPSFIICDEPISALDVSIQAQVINLLMDLQQEMKLTYLFISHDLSMVRHISDNIAVMYLGSIVEYAGNLEIYNNPLHPYTKALFSAIPVPNPRIERERNIIMLEGDVPTPINTSSGCKFAARCPVAEDVCKGETPQLVECAPGHFVACHRLR